MLTKVAHVRRWLTERRRRPTADEGKCRDWLWAATRSEKQGAGRGLELGFRCLDGTLENAVTNNLKQVETSMVAFLEFAVTNVLW